MASDYGDNPYEASDEASESELLNESLSVWKGSWTAAFEVREDFIPVHLDLHTACSLGQYDCVTNKIKRKEDVNRANRGGWTPLMYACYIGHDNIVNLLLDAKANVSSKNTKGRTPLMLAASCGNESVAYFLLLQGAQLEATDNDGWTALFHATFAGHMNVVKLFLDNRANMDTIEPTRGFTPFMEAAAEGHEIIVQYFLQNGVNLHKKSKDGETACTLAMMHGHTKIVGLINNHGMQHIPLRSDAGLCFEGDMSSSDESFQQPRSAHQARGSRGKNKGPSIRDGPEAFQKLMDKTRQSPQHSPHHSPKHTTNKKNYNANVPSGYVTFPDSLTANEPTHQIRMRDVVSPINAEDHRLDSSGGTSSKSEVDEEESSAFSLTGALTIKSSSSSSGGLAAAFGINQDGIDSSEEPVFDDSNVNNNAKKSSPKKIKHRQDNQTCNEQNDANTEHVKHGSRNHEHQSHNQHIVPPANQHIVSPANQHIVSPSSQHVVPPANQHIVPPANQHIVPPINSQQNINAARELSLQAQQELQYHVENRPEHVSKVLEQLGLTKYEQVFDEQDIDLQVFLSLTDNDLKEIGIKLFGPRRKITNYIARWHSEAQPARNDLEQAYADKLEAEMQEMAIQLHKTSTQIDQLKVQASQERELRSVAETCLMEHKATWQQVQHIVIETRNHCLEAQEILQKTKMIQHEMNERVMSKRITEKQIISQGHDSLATAIKVGMNIHEEPKTSHDKLDALTLEQMLNLQQSLLEDVQRSVAIMSLDTDRLLSPQNTTTKHYNNADLS